jgi:hypothetical protein
VSDPYYRLPRRKLNITTVDEIIVFQTPDTILVFTEPDVIVAEPPSRRRDSDHVDVPRPGRRPPEENNIPKISVEPVYDNNFSYTDSYPHRYFFHLVRGEVESIIASVEAPLVQTVSVAPSAASKHTFTVNSYWDEHEGFRRRDISIGGRSGYTPEHLQKFAEFRNFFENAEKELATHKNAFSRGEDIRLVVDFPWEGESYYCNINEGGGLKYIRDRSAISLSYVWALSLHTYGVATAKNVLALQREKIAPFLGDDTVHTGRRHPCRKDATDALNTAEPGDPVSVGGMMDTADEIAYDISDKGKCYSDLLSEGTDLYTAQRVAFDQLPTQRADVIRERLIPIMGWMSNVMMEAALWFGLCRRITPRWILNYVTGGRSEELYAAAANLYASFEFAYWQIFGSRRRRYTPNTADPTSGERVVSTTVTSSDRTVFDIAYRETGDRSMAWRIIELNGLRDARTWKNGQPIAPGDRILIPKPDGAPKSQFADLLGTDWKVVNGDFVLDPTGGDFVRVSGEDCYIQNTVHRLKTVRGTNKAFPATGLLDHIGNGNIDFNVAQVVGDVKRQLQMDYRTNRIVKVDVNDSEQLVLDIGITVETITKSRSLLSYTYTGK